MFQPPIHSIFAKFACDSNLWIIKITAFKYHTPIFPFPQKKKNNKKKTKTKNVFPTLNVEHCALPSLEKYPFSSFLFTHRYTNDQYYFMYILRKKTTRKGTFFELGSAQRCYHFIIKGRKNAIFVGKRCVFFFLQILQNVAESRE